MLLGDKGVGKTAIFNCFKQCDTYYHPDGVEEAKPTNTITTASPAMETISVALKSNGGLVKIAIWDTPGTDKNRSMQQLSLRKTEVLLLVFDVTSKESFKQIEEYYYPMAHDYIPDAYFVLIGNKNDCAQKDRQVTKEEINQWRNDHGNIRYVTTSAETFSNISHLLLDLARYLQKRAVQDPGINIEQGQARSQNLQSNCW